MAKKFNKLILLILGTLLINACATRPVNETSETASRTYSLPLEHWTLSARIAFKSSEDSFSANLNWQKQSDNSDIRLSKLLGGTIMRLSQTYGLVTLDLDGKTYQDRNAERLIYHLTGWLIPVEQLNLWIQGVNTDPNAKVTLDARGRIKDIQQNDGWHVEYKGYEMVENIMLPKSIQLKHNGVSLKIRVNSWDLRNA